MNKKMSKRQRDIKAKLMAAISMLLVSSIMMVSSTYAWFTLSTAPEVTGIQTAVGANGNLEMALMPSNGLQMQSEDYGIKTSTNDSMSGTNATKTNLQANVTWGNLVDLSEGYGLENITLYPSQLALNANEDALINTDAGMLKVPEYGADGRIKALVGSTQAGLFNGSAFYGEEKVTGVRAIGSASGLTDRQLSFRDARNTAKSLTNAARNAADASLTAHGNQLASIAVKYAADKANAKFDGTDIAILNTIITDLEAILDQIGDAYKNYILAFAASSLNKQENENSDLIWMAVRAEVNAPGSTLESVQEAFGESFATLIADTSMGEGMTAYNATVAKVAGAKSTLDGLQPEGADGTYTWAQIRSVLEQLADPTKMMIDKFPPDQVMNHVSELLAAVTGDGLFVYLYTGGGAYADIADQTGNYDASIVLSGLPDPAPADMDIPATMKAQTTRAASFLDEVYSVVGSKEPSGTSSEKMPLTDMYGYIIDLAFRTNAAESNLMLQVDPADRIYDQNNNEDTLGGGSTMTFKSVASGFSNQQILNLMDAIKIVFFNPNGGNIIAYGYLDTAHSTTGADGVTAKIRIQNSDASTYIAVVENAKTVYYYGSAESTKSPAQTEIPQDGTPATLTEIETIKESYKNTSGATLFTRTYTINTTTTLQTVEKTEGETKTYVIAKDDQGNNIVIGTPTVVTNAATYAGPNGQPLVKEGEGAGEYAEGDYLALRVTGTPNGDKIMALTQNVATPVSVLVYLDGNEVTNADVAFSAETSMSGKMNLQFSSSATLVPMEYKALHITGDGAAKVFNVTVPAGVTGEATATQGVDYTFTVADGNTLDKVTVGGVPVTPSSSNGSYTIQGADISGDIVITVKAG